MFRMLGALLFAAALSAAPALEGIELGITKQDAVQRFGPPKVSAAISTEYQSWQYEFEEMDEGEFTHHLIFDRTGHLAGVIRNFPQPRGTANLFTSPQVIQLGPNYPAILEARGRAVLMAPGISTPAVPCTQILLITPELLKTLYPTARTCATGVSACR